MTTFIRLLETTDKAYGLIESSSSVREGHSDNRVFEVSVDVFDDIPGAPFAYWSTEPMRAAYRLMATVGDHGRSVQHGGSTKDDFRFLRVWWELTSRSPNVPKWFPFAKGGAYSPFYADVYLAVNWKDSARELEAALLKKYPYLGDTANWVLHRECHYLLPGLTWTRRTKTPLSMRILPKGCIFADKGPAVFDSGRSGAELLWLLAIATSRSFQCLVELQLAAADARPGGAAHSFEVGTIQRTPVPDVDAMMKDQLAHLARRAWSLKRDLDTIDEVSHAFLLPGVLRARASDYTPHGIEAKLLSIREEIDGIALNLYGFTSAEAAALTIPVDLAIADDAEGGEQAEDEADDEAGATPVDQTTGLLSWTVGVVFGRFDWRLATGERAAPSEPDPFDPLPAKSPGMLPDDEDRFHSYAGILVDDPGHQHDLTRLIEGVLTRIDVTVPSDVRRWLQREFFPFHLQRYSKSRRKAPIYWPLATASGGYTLWLYYPDLNSQTLYTAVNEFIEPKLEQVGQELAALRLKGNARSRDDEKAMEALQTLQRELVELRDTLMQIAPIYRPNHDDGVQIAAAPLWPLFRHKPWQKLLKETWSKLDKGDYDWSHLAMTYWPGRVREKCKTDKSLAIAHGLEELYEPPPDSATGAGRGGRKRRGAAP